MPYQMLCLVTLLLWNLQLLAMERSHSRLSYDACFLLPKSQASLIVQSNEIQVQDRSGKLRRLARLTSGLQGFSIDLIRETIAFCNALEQIEVLSLSETKSLLKIRCGSVACFCLSADCRTLFVADNLIVFPHAKTEFEISAYEIRTAKKSVICKYQGMISDLRYVEGTHGLVMQIASSDGLFLLYDLTTKRHFYPLKNVNLTSKALRAGESVPFAVSSDGYCIAFPDGPRLCLYELCSGQLITSIPTQKPVGQVCFSANNRLVAFSDGHGQIVVHDVVSHRQIVKMPSKVDKIRRLDILGSQILVAGVTTSASLQFEPMQARNEVAEPPDWTQLWNDLQDIGTTKAFRAIEHFVARPESAVQILNNSLHKVCTGDETEVLIRQLGHNDFAMRENATSQLAVLGERARNPLENELNQTTSLEVRVLPASV